jgi:hypothetical protein
VGTAAFPTELSRQQALADHRLVRQDDRALDAFSSPDCLATDTQSFVPCPQREPSIDFPFSVLYSRGSPPRGRNVFRPIAQRRQLDQITFNL